MGVSSLARDFAARERIDASEMLVMPGPGQCPQPPGPVPVPELFRRAQSTRVLLAHGPGSDPGTGAGRRQPFAAGTGPLWGDDDAGEPFYPLPHRFDRRCHVMRSCSLACGPSLAGDLAMASRWRSPCGSDAGGCPGRIWTAWKPSTILSASASTRRHPKPCAVRPKAVLAMYGWAGSGATVAHAPWPSPRGAGRCAANGGHGHGPVPGQPGCARARTVGRALYPQRPAGGGAGIVGQSPACASPTAPTRPCALGNQAAAHLGAGRAGGTGGHLASTAQTRTTGRISGRR